MPMLPGKWQTFVLALIFLFSDASGAYVGINIGTDVFNLPSASEIVSILQSQQIKHVRLFDADQQMIKALANTGIEVIVSIPNDQLQSIGESQTKAAGWINKNIAPFIPSTNITYIAVGNEVLTTLPNAAPILVPAMKYIHSALRAANLNSQVKISSPQSMDMIPKPFPPSTATFNSTWNTIMHQFLQFLENTGSSFMLNTHPYYYFSKERIFPLEFALFQPLPLNKKIIDPNTFLAYFNMFDAMVDAAYYSMESLNFYRMPVLVTESAWPSLNGAGKPEATAANALVYNSNLIQHVLDGSGTPSRPYMAVSTYIYKLFNEDLRPGQVSGKNWEVIFPDGTTMYSLNFLSVADVVTNTSGPAGEFCVANSSADSSALQTGLDWVCGPGSANCSAIQPGQPCYVANNLTALASYAYNDYYHRMQANGGTCSFNGTAVLTTTDPSYGSCIFAGSSGSGTNTSSGSGTNTGGGGTNNNSSSGGIVPNPALEPSSFYNCVSRLQFLMSTYLVIPIMLLAWFVL